MGYKKEKFLREGAKGRQGWLGKSLGVVRQTALVAVCLLVLTVPGQAQDCFKILCEPTVSFSPTMVFTRVLDATEVRMLPSGSFDELESNEEFALFFTMTVPTIIPRFDLGTQLSWMPFANSSDNPFTGYTAEDLGQDEIDANTPELEFFASIMFVKQQQTNGWLSINGRVADQFSPAREPENENAYSHKLNVELGATAYIFNWLPRTNYFSNVTAYLTFDYLATGLAEEGDEMPKGQQVFLEDDSPLSMLFGLTFPIVPLPPSR